MTKKVEAAMSGSAIDKYIVEENGKNTADGTISAYWDPVSGNLETVQTSANDTVTQWATNSTVDNKQYLTDTVADAAAKTMTTYTSRGYVDAPPYGNIPSVLQQSVATGEVTIAGKSVIDGQSVIELNVPNSAHTLYPGDIWVNAQTYQLVKYEEPGMCFPSGKTLMTVVGSCSKDGWTETINFNWVPRSSSLVSQINTPQPPSGYKHISK